MCVKNNYNDNTFSRYDEAISYQEQKLYNTENCPICGSKDFKIMEGNLVCQKCGLCEELFCNSVYGFPKRTNDIFNDQFVKALYKLGV